MLHRCQPVVIGAIFTKRITRRFHSPSGDVHSSILAITLPNDPMTVRARVDVGEIERLLQIVRPSPNVHTEVFSEVLACGSHCQLRFAKSCEGARLRTIRAVAAIDGDEKVCTGAESQEGQAEASEKRLL